MTTTMEGLTGSLIKEAKYFPFTIIREMRSTYKVDKALQIQFKTSQFQTAQESTMNIEQCLKTREHTIKKNSFVYIPIGENCL